MKMNYAKDLREGWGTQAASLFVSAACRDIFGKKSSPREIVAGKLPATPKAFGARAPQNHCAHLVFVTIG